MCRGYAQWLFGDVLNERWSTERAALIQRLARAWEQEVSQILTKERRLQIDLNPK